MKNKKFFAFLLVAISIAIVYGYFAISNIMGSSVTIKNKAKEPIYDVKLILSKEKVDLSEVLNEGEHKKYDLGKYEGPINIEFRDKENNKNKILIEAYYVYGKKIYHIYKKSDGKFSVK